MAPRTFLEVPMHFLFLITIATLGQFQVRTAIDITQNSAMSHETECLMYFIVRNFFKPIVTEERLQYPVVVWLFINIIPSPRLLPPFVSHGVPKCLRRHFYVWQLNAQIYADDVGLVSEAVAAIYLRWPS